MDVGDTSARDTSSVVSGLTINLIHKHCFFLNLLPVRLLLVLLLRYGFVVLDDPFVFGYEQRGLNGRAVSGPGLAGQYLDVLFDIILLRLGAVVVICHARSVSGSVRLTVLWVCSVSILDGVNPESRLDLYKFVLL